MVRGGMTDAKFAALQRAHALGALSDDLYETARARLLEEIAATPAAAPAPAPTRAVGDHSGPPHRRGNIKLLDNQHALFEHADVVKCVAAVGARRPHHHRIERQTDHAVKLFNVNDGADGALERNAQLARRRGPAVHENGCAPWR